MKDNISILSRHKMCKNLVDNAYYGWLKNNNVHINHNCELTKYVLIRIDFILYQCELTKCAFEPFEAHSTSQMTEGCYMFLAKVKLKDIFIFLWSSWNTRIIYTKCSTYLPWSICYGVNMPYTIRMSGGLHIMRSQ